MPAPYPELNARALGWLKFIHRKATTADDWSSAGAPHSWWDQYSTPPMTNFPRFDLADSAYAVALMADKTPAWREVYARILGELVRRHTTFWAAVDWLTQIGPDPKRKSYPEAWRGSLVPEHLWGRYDSPGWTANGVEPWGLQADPIRADGMLFFKGFFNLILSLHSYVSGERSWNRPFAVTGLEDRQFEWTHEGVASHLTDQWRRHPEGPHCENTKIWPYCLSAAGLGLRMFDQVTGRSTHAVAEAWLDFARQHYMIFEDGRLKSVALYYDPIVDHVHHVGTGGGLAAAWYVLPQNAALAEIMYLAAVEQVGWRNPRVPVAVPPDPRGLVMGAMLAREFGDAVTEARLQQTLERAADPRFFGAKDREFGFWFHFDEPWPRGQLSASLMVTEVADPGDWRALFNRPNLTKFAEPTVEGVDFPTIGLSQAWNDLDHGMLQLRTYAASPSDRGRSTSFKVTNVADVASAFVRCDGEEFSGWSRLDDHTIEIRTDVDEHGFQIFTGHRAIAEARAREGGGVSLGGAASFGTDAHSPITSMAPSPDVVARATGCPCCG
jgi:hypothetical protein